MTRLFLIGYRCVGKSTVARLVAEHWGWDWIDADAELERIAGKSIRKIFDEEGESSFRARESAVLASLCERERLVIATGGGVVLRPENRERLKSGKVVWLSASGDEIWRRMQADATTGDRRPNLAQGGLAEVESLLAARDPLYRGCADVRVETADRTPAEIVLGIVSTFASAG